jgi:hypothetical protein
MEGVRIKFSQNLSIKMYFKKGVTSLQSFYNLYIPFLPKIGKNLIDPPTGFSNREHLLVICE